MNSTASGSELVEDASSRDRSSYRTPPSSAAVNPTRIANAATVAPLPPRKSFNWKPVAAVASIATAAVIGFVSLTNRSQPPQPQSQPTQVVVAPTVAPTPEPRIVPIPQSSVAPTPEPVVRSNYTGAPTPTPGALPRATPTPKPNVPVTAKPERVEKTKDNSAAMRTEAARKRRLADQILNQ